VNGNTLYRWSNSVDWAPFDCGATVGTRGSEDGTIDRDEEHPFGARITLEHGSTHAPLTITCGIYGWMFHTRFFGSPAEANREYDSMKVALQEILGGIPTEAEATRERMSSVSTAIEAFVKNFP
jgi:hypothetical protein